MWIYLQKVVFDGYLHINIVDVEIVYCAVRTESYFTTRYFWSLKD